jgi:hypothetical protein
MVTPATALRIPIYRTSIGHFTANAFWQENSKTFLLNGSKLAGNGLCNHRK